MINLGNWQFDFSEPWLVALSLLLLISLLITLRAATRRLFNRAPVRALAVLAINTIAYGAVCLLLLEPRINQTSGQTIFLVTEGADMADVRIKTADKPYVAPGVDRSSATDKALANASWLLDIEQLELREPALNTIEVHGFGLDANQWRSFPTDIKLEFEPPDVSGFSVMRWQRSVAAGENLRVNGRYLHDDGDAIVELRLLDPAANIVDETRIRSGQDFDLTARVKSRGNLEYTLQAWSADVLQSEQLVPLEAAPGNRLNIMIKHSAPSFDTRALKAYAAAHGHGIRFHTDISNGQTIRQSANLDGDDNSSFSPVLLAEQDLLIMDGRALAGLSPIQTQWLADAVEQGLGLLLLADSGLLENFNRLTPVLLNGFSLVPLRGAEPMVVPRLLIGGATDWQEPVTAAGLKLGAENADVLIDDGLGRNLVVRRSRGLGQISISLVDHVHTWLTAGQRVDWGDYWSTLIAATSRQRGGSFLLRQAETEFFRPGQRLAVCALTTEKDAGVAVSAAGLRDQPIKLELQLAADNLNSPRKCAYFWPLVSGWHQLELISASNKTQFDQKAIYVFRDNQWPAQQRELRVTATRAMAAGSKFQRPETAVKQLSEPLGVFLPWLILVLSAMFLWLERKLDFVPEE